jgi:hypothetical protein
LLQPVVPASASNMLTQMGIPEEYQRFESLTRLVPPGEFISNMPLSHMF